MFRGPSSSTQDYQKGSITLGTIKKVSLVQNIKIERIRSNRFVLLQSFLSEQLLTTIRWGLILLNCWFFFLWQMLNKVIKRIGRKKKNSRAQKQNKKSRRGETRQRKENFRFFKKSIEIDAQRFFLFPVFPLRKCSIALYSWIENCQKPEKVYVVVKSPATTKTILKIA